MLAPVRPVSVEAFEQFIRLPENVDKSFELIGGEIVEMVSNNRSSELAARLIRYLYPYVDDNNLGLVTSSDGRYEVEGERYIPDAAYNSFERQTAPTDDAYYPEAPELAIEVISPTDSEPKITIKVGNYLAAGTVVWVVYPAEEEIHVYVPGQKVRVYTKSGTLDGSPVLPGFSLLLSRIFRNS